MKPASLILLCALVRGAELATGGAGMNGVWVDYTARLEPGLPAVHRIAGGVRTTKDLISRHLANFENLTYFGYDLIAESTADGRFRLRFQPLTLTPRDLSQTYPQTSHWTALPLPARPVSLEVRAGETVALDLFVNPSTGQKITDYLTVKGYGRQQSSVEGPARDFAIEDVSMVVSAPQASIDGKTATEMPGSISGAAVWLDLPGHGRFVLSLAPRRDLGMQKLGEIRGTTMTWRSGGHDYSVSTDKPIAPGSRAYNLYVFPIPRIVESFGMSAGPAPDGPIRNR